MKAHTASRINAIILIVIGAWGYVESGSLTSNIPVFIGLVLLLLNKGIKNSIGVDLEELSNQWQKYLKREYLFAKEYYSSFTSEYQQDSWAHIGSDVFWKAKSGELDYIYFAGICGINAILGDNCTYKRITMSRIRAAINGYKSETIYLKEEKENPGKMLTIADRELYRKIKKLVDWNYFRCYTYNNRLSFYSTKIKDPNELMGMVLEDRSKRKNGIDKDKEHKLKKKFGLI